MDAAQTKAEARKQMHFGQPQVAVQILQGVLAQFGADPEAHALMGAALAQSGGDAASVGHFEQAVRLAPRRASHHYNLGVAYERVGRPDWAIEGYRHALQADPYFEPACRAYYRLAPEYAPAGRPGGPPIAPAAGRMPEAVGRDLPRPEP